MNVAIDLAGLALCAYLVYKCVQLPREREPKSTLIRVPESRWQQRSNVTRIETVKRVSSR